MIGNINKRIENLFNKFIIIKKSKKIKVKTELIQNLLIYMIFMLILKLK